MNAPFQVAQLSPSGNAPVRIIQVTKPLTDQAVVLNLGYDQKTKLDLSAIANEKITLVHIGERLIILFDNKSTVTVEPFFDSMGVPRSDVAVELEAGRDVQSSEFATLFPITTDQSILPAAGAAAGNVPSGANFSNPSVPPLTTPDPIPLLGQEVLGNFTITQQTNTLTSAVNLTPFQTGASVNGVVEEEQFTGDEPSSEAGVGNEDETSAPDLDLDNGVNDVTTLVVDGSLAALVGGGDPPLSFEIVDVTADADLLNDVVRDTGGAPVTSLGAEVKYLFIDSSHVEGWTDIGSENERLIFTLTVNPDGTFTFVLNDQLDHAFGDNIEGLLNLNLTSLIQVSDSNGDSLILTGDAFSISAIDDVPITDEAAIVTVDEDDLTGPLSAGNNDAQDGDDGETDGSPVVTGYLNFSLGADAYDPSAKTQPPIVSFASLHGQEVMGAFDDASTQHVESQDRPLYYYWDASSGTLYGTWVEPADFDDEDPTSDAAFKLAVVDHVTGEFQFTLLDQLDHLPAGTVGEATSGDFPTPSFFHIEGEPSASAFEDNIRLDLTFTVTDYDGDSVSGSVSISIDDDIPVAIQNASATVSAKVVEDALSTAAEPTDLSEGNLDGRQTTDDDEASGSTGSLTALFSPGADEPLTFSLSSNTDGLPQLYSHGEAVSYDVSGGTLTASTSFGTVFTLTVNADGSWAFDLDDQLDHEDANGDTGFDLVTDGDPVSSIDFSSMIVATDADGDSVTGSASGSFTIAVENDIPVFTGVDDGTVDMVAFDTVSDSFNLGIGADEPGSYDIKPIGQEGLDLYFEPVEEQPDGTYKLVAKFGDENGDVFYELVFDPDGDSYTFTLVTPPTTTSTVENNITIGAEGPQETISLSTGGTITFDGVKFDPFSNPNDGTDDINPNANGFGIDNGNVDTDEGFIATYGGITAVSLAFDIDFGGEGVNTSYVTWNAYKGGVLVASDSDVPVQNPAVGQVAHFSIDPPGGIEFDEVSVQFENVGGSQNIVVQNFSTETVVAVEDVSLDFQLVATDADGDEVSADFTITLEDNVPFQSGTVSGLVEEEHLNAATTGTAFPHLSTGNEDTTDAGAEDDFDTSNTGPGADVTTNIFSGTSGNGQWLSGKFLGGDGDLDFKLVGAVGDNIQDTNEANLTSNGVDVEITAIGATSLTGGTADGRTVFTLTLDQETGGWTFTLYDQLDHHPVASADNVEGNIAIDFSPFVQAFDENGSTVGMTDDSFAVTVIDDIPLATDDSASVTEGTETANILLILDTSGSMAGSNLTLEKSATINLLNSLHVNQVLVVDFNGDLPGDANNSGWLSVASAISYINGLSADGKTNYDAALNEVYDHFNDPHTAATKTIAYFVSDGAPNEPSGDAGIDSGEATAWATFLTNNNVSEVFGVKISSASPDADIAPIAWPNDAVNNIAIDDANDLVGTSTTPANSVSGNVLTDGVDDAFGADGGRILSITINGTTYTWNGLSGASSVITETGIINGTINGATSVTAPTGLNNAQMTFYFATGSGHNAGDWSYTSPGDVVSTSHDIFTYVLTDNDGDQAPATLDITVTAVNDAPINTVPGAQSTNEDTGKAIAGLSIADVDAGGATNITTTLSVAYGTLTVLSAGGAAVLGSGGAVVTLTGTVAQINTTLAAANNVLYKGVQDYNGSDTLTMVTNDNGNTGGGALSDTDTVGLTVNAVNDGPVNNVPASISVTEDTATKLTAISIADVDSALSNITVTMSLPGGSGGLSASDFGGVTVGGSSTALTLTGTVANINAFLANAAHSVTYTPAANATADVTLTINTNDNGNTGIDPLLTGTVLNEQDTDTVTLDLIAVNDAPQLSLNSGQNVRDEFGAAAYGNNNGSANWAGDWTESSDSSGATGGDIQIVSGELRFGNGGTATIDRVVNLAGATSATLSFNVREVNSETGEDVTVFFSYDGTNFVQLDQIDINDGAVTKSYALSGAFSANSTVRFVVDDFSQSDEYIFIDNVNIAFTTPTGGHTATYTENGAGVAIADTDSLITDIDDTNMVSASIVLANKQTGDQFSIGGTPVSNGSAGSVSGIGYTVLETGGTITISLSGSFSKSTYESAIEAITFANTTENPATVARTVNVTVNDGDVNSNTATTTIAVVSVNDPPVQTGDHAATVAEGGTYTITGSDLGFTDPDDNAAGVTFTASSLTNGIVQVDGVTQNTFTGTQLAANQVTFVHNGTETLTASFQVSVEDGNEDSSVPVAQAFNFTVTAVNDAPVAVDDIVLTNIVDFSAINIPNAALLFNDTDPDGPAALSVSGVSNPVGGTVAPGAIFDPTDLAPIVNTYNFVGVTTATATAGGHRAAQINNAADDGDTPLTTLGAPSSFSGNLAFNSNYDAIEALDSSRFTTADPSSGDHSVFLAEFDISENPAQITQLEFKIVARQTPGSAPDANEGLEFGIYNYSTNAWESVTEVLTTADNTFQVTKTGTAANYINASGKVDLVLYNEFTASSVNQTIDVNYVELKVSSQSSFTSGSFDYTASDSLASDPGSVSITGLTGSTITGTAAGEILIGGSAAETINGAGGNDYIIGGAGGDILIGGGGADMVDTGAADDNVQDIIRFSAATEYGDTINNFDATGTLAQADRIEFAGTLNTLFDDITNNDDIQFSTDNNTNDDNIGVNLNATFEALFLDGANSEGVLNASLTNATAVAAEFSAEFSITAAAGESALLVVNDTDSNSASIWQYTEATGAAGGAGEITAGELTFMGLINGNAAIATGNLDLVP